MDIDHLSRLPVDLFINQITYLPFGKVTSVCSGNKTLHGYCTDPRYSIKWERLIDNTFRNVHNYQEKLEQMQNKLGIDHYNYLVYTQLINILDPVTQAMIYYKQNDMESFNKLTKEQQFLALFLLNKQEIKNYIPDEDDIYSDFIDLMNKSYVSKESLDDMTVRMAANGNIKGVAMLRNLGGDISSYNELALRKAVENGHLDMVKYLIENGLNGNVRHATNSPLVIAAQNGRLDIVKYLTSKYKYDFYLVNEAHVKAMENNYVDVAVFLETGK